MADATDLYVHGVKQFEVGELEEIRLKAHKLCGEFLNGAWKIAAINDIRIQKIGGGLRNRLYLCSLPKDLSPQEGEPSRVLLRLYSLSHEGENIVETHLSECIVLTMLSEKQRGPHIYGIFPAGRLEQYIPSRPLTTDELLDEEISGMIAEAFAQLHSMVVPLTKDPTYLWHTLDRCVSQIENHIRRGEIPLMTKGLKDVDLREELRWLESFLISFQSPVVFCHNDLQVGNILLKESKTGKKSIVLIDFEYCAYNYRGFDLANNLCVTMFDLTNEHFPYYSVKTANYPTRDKQARFVETYLKNLYKRNDIDSEEIERVLDELEAFVLASHFFWAVWCLPLPSTATIPFDFCGYGQMRLSTYFEHKKNLLRKLS